jgi:hypothetical protein
MAVVGDGRARLQSVPRYARESRVRLRVEAGFQREFRPPQSAHEVVQRGRQVVQVRRKVPLSL